MAQNHGWSIVIVNLALRARRNDERSGVAATEPTLIDYCDQLVRNVP